jgi:hypothetical protein
LSDDIQLDTGSLPGLDDNPGDDSPGFDPEAPYGRKKDGTPAKKRGRQPGSSGGSRTTSLAKLEPELADKIVEYIGLPMTVISPLAAGVIDNRAEKTAKSCIRLAESSPRFRQALESFIKGSAVSDIGLTAVAVLVAIRIDRTDQTPEEMGMVARYFDIDEIYYLVYPEAPQNGNGSVEGIRRMGLYDEV